MMRLPTLRCIFFVSLITFLAAGTELFAQIPAAKYYSVKITSDDSIQEGLISTVPIGIFTARNKLATPFEIASEPKECGPDGGTGTSACNFYDGFGFSGNGQTITLDVSIPNPTFVYTLMNIAFENPADGQTLATIEFFGSDGAKEVFPYVAGRDVRDVYHGAFSNGLINGIPNVTAVNAFTCVDPTNCLGAGGTGNVNTGLQGTYVLDEQKFSLSSAFQTQNLVKIVITDTYNGTSPLLLGITVR